MCCTTLPLRRARGCGDIKRPAGLRALWPLRLSGDSSSRSRSAASGRSEAAAVGIEPPLSRQEGEEEKNGMEL